MLQILLMGNRQHFFASSEFCEIIPRISVASLEILLEGLTIYFAILTTKYIPPTFKTDIFFIACMLVQFWRENNMCAVAYFYSLFDLDFATAKFSLFSSNCPSFLFFYELMTVSLQCRDEKCEMRMVKMHFLQGLIQYQFFTKKGKSASKNDSNDKM